MNEITNTATAMFFMACVFAIVAAGTIAPAAILFLLFGQKWLFVAAGMGAAWGLAFPHHADAIAGFGA
jgi:hypothetical protein